MRRWGRSSPSGWWRSPRPPPHEATHWTSAMHGEGGRIARVPSKKSGVITGWSRTGRNFKLSTDPKFTEKLHDIVGLYVDPPAHAVVISVDEKSQIQALDRTQPGLPIKKGRGGTMTHDYKRHGTTTLFAALNVLDGSVIGRNMQRHRHQEFIRFLNTIERRSLPAKRCMRCSTIMRLTNMQRCALGSPAIRAGPSTSRPPRHLGSTLLKASSLN